MLLRLGAGLTSAGLVCTCCQLAGGWGLTGPGQPQLASTSLPSCPRPAWACAQDAGRVPGESGGRGLEPHPCGRSKTGSRPRFGAEGRYRLCIVIKGVCVRGGGGGNQWTHQSMRQPLVGTKQVQSLLCSSQLRVPGLGAELHLQKRRTP